MARARTRRIGALLVLAVAVLPGGAAAVDGVLEINAAAAAFGSVTPGDGVGYPVTLSLPGSYRLTSNLSPPDQGTDVIEITASNVVIDLNGFSILGTSVCTPGPDGHVTMCSNGGTGNGVSGSTSNVAIERGLIQGMGNLGVSMGNGDGLVVGAAVRVRGGQFADNASIGMNVGASSTLRDCSVVSNGGTEILVGNISLVESCLVSLNVAAGIDFGALVMGKATGYRGNVISANGPPGNVTGTAGVQLGENICGGALCP